MGGNSLGTSMQFDSFRFPAMEIARSQFEIEQNQWICFAMDPLKLYDRVFKAILIYCSPSAKLFLDLLLMNGVKLMLKMGWRRGDLIKSSKTNANYDLSK
uniref:Uncharacterized protein n=1 Tax=Tanacetum cinerariifolium TaxID=118510 RepID=A0A6L2P743_TANCI|nr:hypothetical protein [Tanacetum cinerariifolium]GEU93115.1 hypothetical protein [Tanacetum cinerariifolium]